MAINEKNQSTADDKAEVVLDPKVTGDGKTVDVGSNPDNITKNLEVVAGDPTTQATGSTATPQDPDSPATPEAPADGPATFMGAPIPSSPPLISETTSTGFGDTQVQHSVDEETPEDAYIEDVGSASAVPANPHPKGSNFSDEFVGVSGRYMIDPVTGIRKPVYERYVDPVDGRTKTRRAA